MICKDIYLTHISLIYKNIHRISSFRYTIGSSNLGCLKIFHFTLYSLSFLSLFLNYKMDKVPRGESKNKTMNQIMKWCVLLHWTMWICWIQPFLIYKKDILFNKGTTIYSKDNGNSLSDFYLGVTLSDLHFRGNP